MSNLKSPDDYTFVLPETPVEKVTIKLTSGEFEGVIYEYDKVGVTEDKESDSAYLNFEFTIIENNELEELENNLDFKNHMGAVLTSIIMSQIENSTGEPNELGVLDTKASNI